MTRSLPFKLQLHRGVGEGATSFPVLLHFTLDPYPIVLSVKQGRIKYHFLNFGMTRPGIERRFPEPLANTLLISSMVQFKHIKVLLFLVDHYKIKTDAINYLLLYSTILKHSNQKKKKIVTTL